MVVGFNDDTGAEVCILAPWRNDDEKDFFCRLITLAFALHGVSEYHVMSEAWVAQAPVGSKEAESLRRSVMGGKHISELAGRQEILIVAGVSYADPGGRVISYEMVRAADGTLTRLDKMGGDLKARGGLLLSLLPPVGMVMPEESRPTVEGFLKRFRWEPDFLTVDGEM